MRKIIVMSIVTILWIVLSGVISYFLLQIPEEEAYKRLCYSFPIMKSMDSSAAFIVVGFTMGVLNMITLYLIVCCVVEIMSYKEKRE